MRRSAVPSLALLAAAACGEPARLGPTDHQTTALSASAPPASCAEIRAANGAAGDGDYVLSLGEPVTVYCANMASSPADYLSLPNAGLLSNFSQSIAQDGSGPLFTTSYTRVRFNPKTLSIDVTDAAFASTSPATAAWHHARYASAGSCDALYFGWSANLDLSGTPFAISRSPEQFELQGMPGVAARGWASYGAGDQVLNLNSPGPCLSTAAFAPVQLAWLVPPRVVLSGTVGLGSSAISGGTSAPITLSLPSFSSGTQTVTFTDQDGGTLRKASNGQPLTSADLLNAGNGSGSISVLPPTSLSTDDRKVYVFALTAANAANSVSQTSANTVLTIYPIPRLASSTIGVAPGSITGGTTPTLSLTLPALTSPSPSSATGGVVLTANCGASYTVARLGGGAFNVNDLGTTVRVDAPTTASTDNKICTYSLVVDNAATVAASTTAMGTLLVRPAPTGTGPLTSGPASVPGGTGSN
jgi:hypothetical protein